MTDQSKKGKPKRKRDEDLARNRIAEEIARRAHLVEKRREMEQMIIEEMKKELGGQTDDVA